MGNSADRPIAKGYEPGPAEIGTAAGAKIGLFLPLMAWVSNLAWKMQHVIRYGASQSVYYPDLVDPSRYQLDFLVYGTFAVPMMIVCGLVGATALPILAAVTLRFSLKRWTTVAGLAVSLLVAAILPFATIHASWIGLHRETPSLADTKFWLSLSFIVLVGIALSLHFSRQAVARLESQES